MTTTQGKRAYDLDELNDLADLPRIINQLYPDARAKEGVGGLCFATWRGNSKTPSFNLFNKDNRWGWYDLGNTNLPEGQNGGNAYQFLIRIANMQEKEAYAFLLDHLNLSDAVFKPLASESVNEQRQAYIASRQRHGDQHPEELTRRGITKDSAKRHAIYQGDRGIVFPILDQHGNVYDFKVRFEKGDMRYMFIYGKDRLHIMHYLKPTDPAKSWLDLYHEADAIFIVEGELNAIAAQQAMGDMFCYVAYTGEACHVVGELYEDKNVFIYTDEERISKSLTKKIVDHNPNGVNVLPVLPKIADKKQDYCDVLGKSGDEELSKLIHTQIMDSESVFNVYDKKVGLWTVDEHLDAVDRRLSGQIVYPTGFKELDISTGGLEETGLTLICALSQFGKSTLLRQFIDSILTFTKEKIRIYTPDQNSVNLMYLMALYRAKIDMTYLTQDLPLIGEHKKRFKDHTELRDYFRRVHKDTLINYSKRLQVRETLDGKEARAESMIKDMEEAADKGVRVFAIDYIQFYSLYGQHEGDTMIALKDFARRTKSQIIIAAQLSKSKFGHDRPSNLGGIPIATDIEGRGATYALSDQVFAIYIQDKFMQAFGYDSGNYQPYDINDRGKARIYVLKHKMREADYFRYTDWLGSRGMFRCLQGGRNNIHDSYLDV